MGGKGKRPATGRQDQKSDPDFVVRDEGTVWVFTPQSDRARKLVSDIGLEEWQRAGQGFALDHRPARELVTRHQAAGFTVGPDRGQAPGAESRPGVEAGTPREARGRFFSATVEEAQGHAGGCQTRLEWEGGFLRLSEADVQNLRQLLGHPEAMGTVLAAATEAMLRTGRAAPDFPPIGPGVGDFAVVFDQIRFQEETMIAGRASSTGRGDSFSSSTGPRPGTWTPSCPGRRRSTPTSGPGSPHKTTSTTPSRRGTLGGTDVNTSGRRRPARRRQRTRWSRRKAGATRPCGRIQRNLLKAAVRWTSAQDVAPSCA
jgi:hypothetical protein